MPGITSRDVCRALVRMTYEIRSTGVLTVEANFPSPWVAVTSVEQIRGGAVEPGLRCSSGNLIHHALNASGIEVLGPVFLHLVRQPGVCHPQTNLSLRVAVASWAKAIELAPNLRDDMPS
jgi:hypothetical protein